MHVTVCICTYKRPHLLRRLLHDLQRQHTEDLFTYSVVVVDNDIHRSATAVVAEAARASNAIVYCVEPVQNIARARNKAVENAEGDYIAFIDDDEYPSPDWLLNLLETCRAYDADGVLGPVLPSFEQEPPQWLKKGRFFDRPAHRTGRKLSWRDTRTGNVLLKKSILRDMDEPFDPAFGSGGEDVEFFRRMIQKGFEFVWCEKAVVFEVIPLARCTRGYLLRLALLRGGNSRKHPIGGWPKLAKSVVAVACYFPVLPVMAVCGQHILLKYLIRLFYHTSHICASFGWRLVKEKV